MALRFAFICSAMFLMTCQLNPVYGAPNATDRNHQRDALKAAVKAVIVDLDTWNNLPKTSAGLYTRGCNLANIITAISSVSIVNWADFRSTKRPPSDGLIVEQTTIKYLLTKLANILKGMNTMKIDVNRNSKNDSKGLAAIDFFTRNYSADVTTIQAELARKGVQELLGFRD